MPRTGRPSKPIEQKRALGNPGQRRLPTPIVALAPVVSSQVVDPDDHTPGGEFVRNLLDTAASTWISDPDRLGVLVLIHDAWNQRAALMDYVAENGSSYAAIGQQGIRYYRRPESMELDSLEKRLTTWLSLSGLTPSDRSRLGVAEVKARSRLEDLRVRRDKSRAG